MTRAAQDDFLQSFRFHVIENNFMNTVAGFNSVTLPELSVDPVEFREGNRIYTVKQPGVPTVSDLSLTAGVVRTGTEIWDMIQAYLRGEEYRTQLVVKIYHHIDVNGQEFTFDGDSSKVLICNEAFVTRAKPLGDLDATSSEIMMREVDFALEYFDIESA